MEDKSTLKRQVSPRAAIFLDRDGTINEEVNYLSSPEQLQLIPGVAEGLLMLQQAGYLLVVVTNQSGIARGYFSEKDLLEINRVLSAMLAAQGVKLQHYYHCPHHPDFSQTDQERHCSCRKPGQALFLQAAEELNIDFATSFAIGDKMRDVAGPLELGCRAFLLSDKPSLEPLLTSLQVCPDLLSAAKIILQL